MEIRCAFSHRCLDCRAAKTPFNEKDKFIIDQFIMNGGKVLWFIDPLEVNRDSLYFTGETFGISANLNIEKDMILNMVHD